MKKNIEDLVSLLSTYKISNYQAIFFLSFLVILFFSPLLFFGKILLNADSTYLAYPSAYFFSHFFGSPINSFLFSGYPVTVAFEYGYFHPLYNIFYYLFDFIFAYHSLLSLDFIGAAVFTYFFTRKIGLSIYASLLASLAYTFSQLSIAWLGVPSVANAVFLLPVLMYSVLQIIDLKKKFIFIFGLILGFAFLATHYQFIIISLIGVGAFFIFEIFQRWNSRAKLATNIKPILFIFCGFVIAFIISIPQALSSLGFFGVSTRESILVYSSASHLDLFRYLIPTFNFPYVSLDEFRPYIGVIPLFFASIALYQVWSKNIKEKKALFFSVFFVFTLVASLKYSPFIFILKFIPLIKYFAVQSRWLYIGNFALVILAGFGFDFVLSKKDIFFTEKFKRLFSRIVAFILGLFVIANLTVIFFTNKFIIVLQNYFDSYMYSNTTGLPLSHYHGIIEVLANKLFYNVSFINPNVLLFIFSAVILYFLLSILPKMVLFSNLIILFTAINLFAVSAFTFNLTNKNLITEKSQIADFIYSKEKNNYDYRLFGFAVPFGQYQKITSIHPEAEKEATIFAKEALMGNMNVFSEIPIVGGYNPMAFRRYQNIVAHLENTTAKMTTDEKVSRFLSQLNLLSMLNVKYVISPYVLDSKDLKLVFSKKVTTFNVPLYLYENRNFLSRFYLAKNVVFIPENDEKGSFTKVTENKSKFSDVTFIECDNCKTNIEKEKMGTVNLLNIDNNGFELEVISEKNEWLVVSNEAVPGWFSTIDGNSTRIYYANHAYQAVFVPKGEHKVIFSYKLIPSFSF